MDSRAGSTLGLSLLRIPHVFFVSLKRSFLPYFHGSDIVQRHYLNSLPRTPPAILLAIPPDKALLANVDAWLNLSHLENATVLVIVKMRAIAGH